MPRLFVPNFDFEHRLAFGDGTLPQSIRRINTELAPAWAAIADDRDAIWADESFPAEQLAARGLPRLVAVADPRTHAASHRLVFWGENDWARRIATTWGFAWTGCDPAIVCRVNSRAFKHDLERRLGVELPGTAIVDSTSALSRCIERLDARSEWVLKGEFGGAGREIRFGRGSLTAADEAWAQGRFSRGLVVTLEPRLAPVAEAGVQFEIARDGDVSFLGVTPLFTRPNGSYLGNGFVDDPNLLTTWREAIETGREVAAEVAAEGYFGPLGIDAMRHRTDDGEIRVRALQDLNARYTMGRLALGLRRFPAFAAAAEGVFRPGELCRRP